jgi:hypothetical protein
VAKASLKHIRGNLEIDIISISAGNHRDRVPDHIPDHILICSIRDPILDYGDLGVAGRAGRVLRGLRRFATGFAAPSPPNAKTGGLGSSRADRVRGLGSRQFRA